MNSIEVAGNVQQTMSSREIAELTSKRHDHVLRDIRSMFEQLELSPSFGEKVETTGGRPSTVYHLDRDLTDCLLTGYSAKARMAVIRRWRELENAQQPKMPTTYLEALEKLLDSERQKQAALAERDTAIATKAEIGNRREATAMATASAASRRASSLERDLDRSKEYCTIKRMTMLTHGQSYNWRLLKSACQDLGIPPIDVFDQNYGSVKSYHADVWMEAYALEIS